VDGGSVQSVVYEVSHRTTYRYSIPVSLSHHVLHLTARTSTSQVCHRTALRISPTPTAHSSGKDYFGNPVAFVTLQHQHKELMMHVKSVIEVLPRTVPAAETTAPWDGIYDALSRDTSDEGLEAIQFAFESPQTRISDEIRAYARRSFPPGRPVLEGALDLTRRINREFVFDTTATTVSTPVDDVLRSRRGVCQDFAHLQIACLRALRLPARYVSGYILTRPPEGRDKLIGADASHAWLSVWCPGDGWVDLDPTNDVVASLEHITLAWGREYGDISPVNGAIFGGGAHSIQVGVDVTPLNRSE
jgi:Transglutaminase-like enzymes, putative cysteine proteases